MSEWRGRENGWMDGLMDEYGMMGTDGLVEGDGLMD
jgi:hypothetical protein